MPGASEGPAAHCDFLLLAAELRGPPAVDQWVPLGGTVPHVVMWVPFRGMAPHVGMWLLLGEQLPHVNKSCRGTVPPSLTHVTPAGRPLQGAVQAAGRSSAREEPGQRCWARQVQDLGL